MNVSEAFAKFAYPKPIDNRIGLEFEPLKKALRARDWGQTGGMCNSIIMQVSKDSGVPYSTLKLRVKSGMTLDEAVNKKSVKLPKEFRGKLLPMKEIIPMTGISSSRFYTKVRESGLSVQEYLRTIE